MARAIMIIFGLLLLLPGACALAFAALTIPELMRGPSNGDSILLGILWAVCVAISLGGVFLIRRALSK